METAQRRQTISKLSRIPGYAGGGLLDGLKRAVGIGDSPELKAYKAQAAAERAAKKAAPAATPAPQPAAPMGNQSVIDKRMAEAGAAKGAKVKSGMAKAAMENMGGMLKGPGTPTSDSIPAQVVDTGEPIKVATGERIVSKNQDAFLQQIAAEKGFASVDAMLEAGTGEPVGPTMKYDNDADERPGQKGPNDADGDEFSMKAERGMKCGGAVKRMATGGLVTDEEKRKTLVSQIPTGGSGSEPTPAANQTTPGDGQMPYGEQMRNLGSALASIPVNAMKTLVSAPGYGLNSAPATAQPATPAAKAMATVPSAPAATSPQATPAPVAAPSAPPMGASQQMAAAPAQPAFDPLAAKAERDAQTQKDIALGNQMEATRKASEADGYAAQDRGIDTSIAIAAKVDAERARQRAENTLSSTTDNAATRTQKVAASQALASLDSQQAQTAGNESARQRLATADQTTRRDQDIRSRGQAEQTDALRASQKLAQDKFAQDSKGAAIDQQGKAQIQALQTALLSEQDPKKRQAIEDNLRAVQGKYGREPAPVRHLVVPGGQVTDETGQVRTLPSQVFNPDTGQFIQQPTMGAAGKALPPGMVKQVGTSGGKPVYEDAKGNRHY